MGGTLMKRAAPLIAARLVTACITLTIPLVSARLLSLSSYGTYKQLFLIALTLAAMLPLGVAQSLYYFVPRAVEQRVYFGQTLLFLLAMGALGGALVVVALPGVAILLKNPELADYRSSLAFYTAFLVAAGPFEAALTARGRTNQAAVAYLAWDTLRAAALVLPLLFGWGLHAMMLAVTSVAGLRLAMAWIVMVGATRGALFDARLFREQWAYAVPFGLAMLLAIPQQYAHQFVVASTVGPALFALYAAGCFDPPFVDLLYTPTGDVLMVTLGELDKSGRRAEGVAAFREATAHLGRYLLPGLAFLWAVAPEFVITVFGPRFAASALIFRIWLLAIPLRLPPVEAALRASDETRSILRAYWIKALFTLPAVYLGVQVLGIVGGALSYVLTEVLGRVLLFARLPATFSTPERRVRAVALIPWAELARDALFSSVAAVAGAYALRYLTSPLQAEAFVLRRLVPLGGAALVAIGLYALLLFVVSSRPRVRAVARAAGRAGTEWP